MPLDMLRHKMDDRGIVAQFIEANKAQRRSRFQYARRGRGESKLVTSIGPKRRGKLIIRGL